MDNWTEIGSQPQSSNLDTWKPITSGDSRIGIYLSRKNVGQMNSVLYEFRGDDGKHWSVFGCTVLDKKMQDVKFGQYLKIVFLGRKPSKRPGMNGYKDFAVYTKNPTQGTSQGKPMGNTSKIEAKEDDIPLESIPF